MGEFWLFTIGMQDEAGEIAEIVGACIVEMPDGSTVDKAFAAAAATMSFPVGKFAGSAERLPDFGIPVPSDIVGRLIPHDEIEGLYNSMNAGKVQ